MSVCDRKWHDIVSTYGYIDMSVKEIYNEWYEEMDCISVLKEIIDIREGKGSWDIFNIDNVLHIIHQLVKIFYQNQ